MKQNVLIALSELEVCATFIAHLDTDAANRQLGLGNDYPALSLRLFSCPEAEIWRAEFKQIIGQPFELAETLRGAQRPDTLIQPDPAPLCTIERVRGRILRYREELAKDRQNRAKIVHYLDRIEDYCDCIHAALTRQPAAETWRAQLATYEREQRASERGFQHATLIEAIVARQLLWDPDGRLGPLYHALELCGEAGELANTLKKMERARFGLAGSLATNAELVGEIADVLICTLKLAHVLGIDAEQEARRKFNERSRELGFATRVTEKVA